MLYLVRHGEPEFEGGESRCLGRTDLPLSEKGKQQAFDLAKYFSDKNIEKAYHSYLLRAKQTAELISNGEYPIIQADGLEELDAGDWENLTFREIRSKYPELYERRGHDMAKNPPPNGETFMEGLLRFRSAIESIIKEDQGNVVVVAHASVNKLLLCDALNLNHNDVSKMAQPYGCINIFEILGNILRVESYGEMPLG